MHGSASKQETPKDTYVEHSFRLWRDDESKTKIQKASLVKLTTPIPSFDTDPVIGYSTSQKAFNRLETLDQSVE